MKLRYRKDFEEDDVSRWLVSYADFMTVLFAFFVVLYAVSNINLHKYQQISKSVSKAFDKSTKNVQQETIIQEKAHPLFTKKLIDNENIAKASDDNLNQIPNSMLTKLSETFKSDLGISPYLSANKTWLEFSLGSKTFFKSGQAQITKKALPTLEKLASILKKTRYPIAIEGYTDNLPIKNDKFASNWELSAARAAAVARTLASFGVAPNQISATGFGKQFPIADNDTKKGREKNRRVLIIVSIERKNDRTLSPNQSVFYKKAMIEKQNDENKTLTPKNPDAKMGVFKTKSGGLLFKRIETPKNTAKKPSTEQ